MSVPSESADPFQGLAFAAQEPLLFQRSAKRACNARDSAAMLIGPPLTGDLGRRNSRTEPALRVESLEFATLKP
jgi:hypothetical protein